MRRKPGTLLPLEIEILEAAVDLQRRGQKEFHGFALAKRILELEGARRLTAHGTLYKALARMERSGLLQSRWEDPAAAEIDGRPRRRLYEIPAEGARARARSAASPSRSPAREPGLSSS